MRCRAQAKRLQQLKLALTIESMGGYADVEARPSRECRAPLRTHCRPRSLFAAVAHSLAHAVRVKAG